MAATAGWKVTINGGFAWVFHGKERWVDVGPYRKPVDDPMSADYHPHEMLLRVPAGKVDEAKTTLPFRRDRGTCVFVLRGAVDLRPNDGAESARDGVRRKTSPRRPARDEWNDFYWIYDAQRIRSELKIDGNLRVKDAYAEELLAHIRLRGGELRVRAPRLSGVYRIAAAGRSLEQPLATHIEYLPDTAATHVVFATPYGRVWALPGEYEIAAECGCPDDPAPGTPVPGFDVTFRLYDGVVADGMRFVPTFKGFGSSEGQLDPGPDCPPRGYGI